MSTAELKEIVAELARSTKELRDSQKLTDVQLKESERQLERTSREVERNSREMRELRRFFNDQWGKLVEALLGAGLPELFQARGIEVTESGRDIEILGPSGRKLAQIDVMVRNGGEDIAVEVKSTCRPADIDEHVARLARVRNAKREYSEGVKKLLGAVAALSYAADADVYAEKKGLFVLKISDGVVSIQNSPDFRPKAC